MKTKFLSLLLMILPLITFGGEPEKTQILNVPTGTYTGCENCPNNIVLTINQDFTFHLIDNSKPNKPMNVKGEWTVAKNNKSIILKSNNASSHYHKKWTFDKDYPCIRSINAPLEFIRLCKDN